MGAMVLSCDDKVQKGCFFFIFIIGWRVGGIYRIHRTILYYSFEPPTALNCFGRIFVNRGMYEKVCV